MKSQKKFIYKPYDSTLDTIAYYLGLLSIVTCITILVLRYCFKVDVTKFSLPCLLHHLTNYYCPGCGGTRSFFYMIQGNFLKSLYYHPFVLLTFIPGIWFLFTQSIYRIKSATNRSTVHGTYRLPITTIKPAYLYFILGVLIVQCAFKNILLFFFDYALI